MTELLQTIISKVKESNPLHAKKLRKNIENADPKFFSHANVFFDKYIKYLDNKNKNLDYGINCYLKLLSDTTYEHLRFLETGEYSSKSFDEVKQRVYHNPEIMEYYMDGLLLTQFLWPYHYKVLRFFIDRLGKYKDHVNNYLEIGGGHGLFVSEAIQNLNDDTKFDMVDISPTSIEMANIFTDSNKVNFYLNDIFKYDTNKKYDFITMGEVLEHVEDPVALLTRLRTLLNDNGIIFITAPTNSPAIDHIYLFRNAQEIREVIGKANLKIIDDIGIYVEDVSIEVAEKLKITLMYGAFLEKGKES